MANDPLPARRRGIAHQAQFWAGPLPQRGVLPPRPPTMVYPDVLRGRPRRVHEFQFWAGRFQPVISVLPPTGIAGSGSFLLSLQPGTKVIYSWSTSIMKSYSGKEQRESAFGPPKRRYEGNAFLLDGSSRDIRSAMMRGAADGATFLLALPFEELTLSADSAGTVLTVAATATSDWIVAGQRVVVVSRSGTALTGTLQSATATTLTLDVTPGTTGRAGGLVMPLVPVLLDAQQGFARYPTRVDMWALRARSATFGYASATDSMGAGTSIVTFTSGVPVPLASLVEQDLLIWNRPNAVDGTANESMLSGADVVDLGALPFSTGSQVAPDWGRSLKLRSTSHDDWQWFKAFIRQLRGQQKAFLLSTNHNDLVFDSFTAGVLKVKSVAVDGSGDYTSWFVSAAHRRLAITLTSGAVQYVEVETVTDNLDGTLTLTLTVDSVLSGTPAKLSFLEQVRFERGDIEASWDGGTFTVDEIVRVTQEAIDTQSLHMFDKVLNYNFAYSGVPPDVPPADQEIGILAPGKTTLINFTSDRTLGFGGITLGIAPVDGMIVCISNVNTSTSGPTFVHEDTAWPGNNRLWNRGQGSVAGIGLCVWYRYNATVGRWINIA